MSAYEITNDQNHGGCFFAANNHQYGAHANPTSVNGYSGGPYPFHGGPYSMPPVWPQATI